MKCVRCGNVLRRGTVAVHTSKGEVMHAVCHGRAGVNDVTIPQVPKCTPYDLRLEGGGHARGKTHTPSETSAASVESEPRAVPVESVFEYDIFMSQ